jgi:hypothetical protein
LDDVCYVALEVHRLCSQFARTVQIIVGDDKKQTYQTKREIDHGGLEAVLRDTEPAQWRRNLVRDLVAWLISRKKHSPKIELPEGLQTWEEIDEEWTRLLGR